MRLSEFLKQLQGLSTLALEKCPIYEALTEEKLQMFPKTIDRDHSSFTTTQKSEYPRIVLEVQKSDSPKFE